MPFIIQTLDVEGGFWLPPPWPKLVLDTFRNFHFAFLAADFPVRPLWMWSYPFLALAGLIGLLLKGILPLGSRQPHAPAVKDHQQENGGSSASRVGDGATVILLVCLFALPHIVAFLVSLRSPIYSERPLIWTTLPYLLLVAAGIRFVGGPALGRFSTTTRQISGSAASTGTRKFAVILAAVRQGAQLIIVLAILTLSGLSLSGYYYWFPKEGWDKAAAYIAEQVERGDVIVFNATWVQIPFEYYYKRYGLDTELKGLPVDLFERGQLEPAMAESDMAHVQEMLDGREQVWLVYSHNWYSDPSGTVPMELGKLLREDGRADFTGIQIIRFVSGE